MRPIWRKTAFKKEGEREKEKDTQDNWDRRERYRRNSIKDLKKWKEGERERYSHKREVE